jgi:hypothetical protein
MNFPESTGSLRVREPFNNILDSSAIALMLSEKRRRAARESMKGRSLLSMLLRKLHLHRGP